MLVASWRGPFRYTMYSSFSTRRRNLVRSLELACLALRISKTASAAGDPLPSWHETTPKKAIIVFVEKVAKEGSPDFIPIPERIAVFDNDGTLWAEQPIYFQLAS